jgi:DNA-binding response OmpR family regulator
MSRRAMDKRLLDFLKQHRGKTVTYEDIHKAFPDFISTNYISVTVSRICRKGHRIERIYRVGYVYRGQ